MAKGRFLVAPFNSGLQNDVKPWLLPEDAFELLENAYVFRGRVRKRFGTTLTSDNSSAASPELEQLSSRLRMNVGTTDGVGNLSSSVYLDGSGASIKYTNSPLGSMFSIGNDMFIVYQAAGSTYKSGGSATVHTFDTATGDFVFNGADDNTIVYFYPSLPVMGIVNNETVFINDEPTYCFDTLFSYQFSNNGWERFGDAYWTGSDSDFFWGRVWRGANANDIRLFVTNFNFQSTATGTDPIRYLIGTGWNNFQPRFSSTVATSTIIQARIIIPFKNRLLLMNVVENTGAAPGVNQQYGFRVRFSQNGSPLSTDAFYEDIGGKGGYLDAPTQQQIISADIIKDRMIVFFERSTFELVYTGNEILPFRFQYIDDELGVESTFSIIPFDNRLIGIGDTGIHAATSTSVRRIDNKIPDLAASIGNQNSGLKRVHGIRDYYKELAYWTYPEPDEVFPTKILVYNYRNESWALFDDTITAFGYFQSQNSRTWQASLELWQESEFEWGSGTIQSKFKNVIGGNQQGYIFYMDGDDRNAPALQITDITLPDELVVYEHNLKSGDFIAIENMIGSSISRKITQVFSVSTHSIFIDPSNPISGTYAGGGTVARVSRPDMLTKQYNFYIKDGYCFDVDKVDMYVEKTGSVGNDGLFIGGSFSVDWYVNSSGEFLSTEIVQTYPYDDPYYAFENTQDRVWRRVYPDAEGDVIQFRFYLNDNQMVDEISAWSSFIIHGCMYHATPTRSRLE